jgi:hypothetical protein
MKPANQEIRSTVKRHGGVGLIKFDYMFTLEHLRGVIVNRTIKSTESPFIFEVTKSVDVKRPRDEDLDKMGEMYQLIRKLLPSWSLAKEYRDVIEPPSDAAKYIFFVNVSGLPSSDYVVKVYRYERSAIAEFAKFTSPTMDEIRSRVLLINNNHRKDDRIIKIIIPDDFVLTHDLSFSIMRQASGKTLKSILSRLEDLMMNTDGTSVDHKLTKKMNKLIFEGDRDPSHWRTLIDNCINTMEDWINSTPPPTIAKGHPNDHFFKERDRIIDMCQDIGRSCAAFDIVNLTSDKIIHHDDLDGNNVLYDEKTKQVYWIDFEALELRPVDSWKPSILRHDRFSESKPLCWPVFGDCDYNIQFYLGSLALKHQLLPYLNDLVTLGASKEHIETAERDIVRMMKIQLDEELFQIDDEEL